MKPMKYKNPHWSRVKPGSKPRWRHRTVSLTSTEMALGFDPDELHICTPHGTLCAPISVRFQPRWVADKDRSTLTVCPECLAKERPR